MHCPCSHGTSVAKQENLLLVEHLLLDSPILIFKCQNDGGPLSWFDGRWATNPVRLDGHTEGVGPTVMSE
jgi:hypothetical protein